MNKYMKTFKNNLREEYLFVEVPLDAYNIQLSHHCIGFKHDNYSGETDTNGFYHIRVGLGAWRGYQIISTTKDIKEEIAKSIVGKTFAKGYYEFLKLGMMRVASMKHSYPFDTAKESLQSLITSLGLDINKNYLILKKI